MSRKNETIGDPNVDAPKSVRRRPRRPARAFALGTLATVSALGPALAAPPRASEAADRAAVAALDVAYQAAVRVNDAAAMGRILADDFILVTGKGSVYDRKALLDSAIHRDIEYEKQDEIAGTQTVRLWGDTAVVTALLWIKGKPKEGEAIDFDVWFSDTYVRTPDGWRYAFGQAGAHLPHQG